MFDRYVSAQDRSSPAKQVLIIISVAAHAIVLVGLVIYSFIHVEEVNPPPLTVTFFASAPPPPPPPPPPAGKKNPTKPKTPKPVIQPQEIQPLIPPKEKEPEPEEEDEGEGEEGGVEGGVAGGVAGGVVGGVVGGVLGSTGPTTQEPPPKPKTIAHELDPSEVIYRPDPHLPDVVKIQRKGTGDATFFAKVCIDQGGKVFKVDILQGIPGADESIRATILQWRYKPQPIPVCFPARWVFSIQ